MSVFKDEKIWRIVTNLWTIFFICFLVADFFLKNRFEFLTAPLSTIYIAVLGLYVSTKEFDRWYDLHTGRHPGEIFVIVWTVVIFALLGISIFQGGGYKLSSEIVGDYIMVLSVFALTQKSKSFYERKKTAREKKGKRSS